MKNLRKEKRNEKKQAGIYIVITIAVTDVLKALITRLSFYRDNKPSWKEIARNRSQLVTNLLKDYDKRIRPYTGGKNNVAIFFDNPKPAPVIK